MTRILYVCPSAHYSGHHPHVTSIEPITLQRSGLDIEVLTFCGIMGNPSLSVKCHQVVNDNAFLRWLRRKSISRWFLMLTENFLTLQKASRMHTHIIHLRDGDPFLFMPFLVSLPHRNLRWVISLTGSVMYAPKVKFTDIVKSPLKFIYTQALNLVSSSVWIPVYRLAMRYNTFILTPQNDKTLNDYSSYMSGIFKSNLSKVPRGFDIDIELSTREVARKKLDIPLNKTVLLSFGAPHQGKNLDVIFRALQEFPNIILIQAGTHVFSLNSNPTDLARKYNVLNQIKFFDYYIPEEDKKYFFAASDASILSYTKVFASTSSMLGESCRYSTPVIASNANMIKPTVEKYKMGLLFESEDIVSLIETMYKFLQLNSLDIERMKQRCAEYAKDNSIVKWSQQYNEIYQKLIPESIGSEEYRNVVGKSKASIRSN